MVTGRTLVHALVGALVGVVLSFIPFSTVIGGAVAGFLEGPDGRDGAVVGALAGAITFVPILAGVFLVAAVFGVGVGVAAIPLEGGALALVLIGFLSMIVLLYTVGLALLGGYLGAYLASQYPEQYASTRESLGSGSHTSAGRYSRPDSWDAHDRSPRERGRTHEHERDRWGSPDSRDDRSRSRSWSHDHTGDDRSNSGPDGETFQPDPNHRHDPARWLESDEANDKTGVNSETEQHRETERERDRE
ncbi:ECF transporter S component [Natronolimnobius sp. AArcel1]|uniref:DUF5518 domain-containing protein n=1 Tax=Natronolimnobius sp. AArcel1 TaxID=1679093 RepID=UPI0013EC85C0|nr:DUF5518 domain-containing protein [Natronolimnobius sp. AArcel1]NGM68698.1 ECF transporter S component [Natronolimnobius sp. AArcel1]